MFGLGSLTTLIFLIYRDRGIRLSGILVTSYRVKKLRSGEEVHLISLETFPDPSSDPSSEPNPDTH